MPRHTPNLRPSNLKSVSQALKEGGVALLPTETVYGLAADGQNADAVNALYAVKGRGFDKPIALCVSSIKAAQKLVHWTDSADTLARHFWPGPLSLILRAKQSLSLDERLLGRAPTGERTLSLRCPDIGWRDKLGVDFLALTSANKSGQSDTTDFNTAYNIFGADIAAAYEGAPSEHGKPSTIIAIDNETERLTCLRWGALGPDDFAPLALDWTEL